MSKTKDTLVRFSVAIGGELLKRFDQYREEHQYPNRSEAVRGLMRDALIEETIERDDAQAMGVLTLVYDHHKAGIAEKLTELQHHHLDRVVTTTHVHLDEARCLEVILLRGPSAEVRAMADALTGVKGIETGRLVLASAEPVTNGHGHSHGHGHTPPHPHPHEHGPRRKAGKSG